MEGKEKGLGWIFHSQWSHRIAVEGECRLNVIVWLYSMDRSEIVSLRASQFPSFVEH